MNSQVTVNSQKQNNSLAIARVVWVVYALILLVIHIASQIASLREIQTLTLTARQMQGLQEMGLTAEFYAAWRLFWQIPLPLFWGGMGFLIFWRRSNDRAALVISAMMLGLSLIGSIPLWKSFANAYPDWVWIVAPVAFISNICVNSFFFVFPTGRYVPRWTFGIAMVLSAYNILNSYQFALPPSLVELGKSLEWFFPIFGLVTLIAIIGAPIYRYRRVSTPIEREQIKWVVVTIVVAFTFFALAASTVFLAPNANPDTDLSIFTVFVQPLGWIGFFQLIAIAIGISILRYRLFDIDIIIRRTVTYSILTAILGAVYFGAVVILQQLFRAVTGQNSEVAIIVSTLVIALMFVPVRRRVQDFLDRRFYRKKYDAQQVLARFAKTARDETDIDKLTNELIRVVDETMQPESVELWLKKQEAKRK